MNDMKVLRRESRDGQAVLRRRGGRHTDRRREASRNACRGRVDL